MGLRCIIGHDYGDRETTEHREERGNERVVTVEEFRECQRCGHRKVMSENTEIRTVEQAESGTTADETEPESPPAETADGDEAEDEDGGFRRGDDEDAGRAEHDEETAERTAADDDGVILESESEGADRERGEWPESEDETQAQDEGGTAEEWPDDHAEAVRSEPTTASGEWPAHEESEDEGIDAEPTSGAPSEDVEFGGGLAPEATESSEETDADATAPDRDQESAPGPTASGIERASSGPTPTAQQRATTTDAVLECPNCESRSPTRDSSLRPGDICPECQRGYLDETAD